MGILFIAGAEAEVSKKKNKNQALSVCSWCFADRSPPPVCVPLVHEERAWAAELCGVPRLHVALLDYALTD